MGENEILAATNTPAPSYEREQASPAARTDTSSALSLRYESLCFTLTFVLIYATLAVLFFREPRLFRDLDQAFDADLGSWTIDLARPQGPHSRTQIHPLSVLLLNPLGSSLRVILRTASVGLAARLAAQLLCAIAGGLAVGAFRTLLARLDVSAGRARLWTLLFATSATQVVFSSLPESYAFSALSLVAVFVVAAGRRPPWWARLVVGVLAFGVTITNIVAVTLARASGLDWRRWRYALRSCAAHLAAVISIVAALSLVQRAAYPTAAPFFVPHRLAYAYESSFFVPQTALEAGERLAGVLSHVAFACLAAPALQVRDAAGPRPVVQFADIAILTPTPVSAVHWLVWALVLCEAVRGSLPRPSAGAPPNGEQRSRRVVGMLWLWLGFVVALHCAFGVSFFLYSGHWVFALLALAATGIEARPRITRRAASVLLVALLTLQVAAQTALVRQMLAVFAGS